MIERDDGIADNTRFASAFTARVPAIYCHEGHLKVINRVINQVLYHGPVATHTIHCLLQSPL